jgi:antimicrobial peptide system SdpA family protein
MDRQPDEALRSVNKERITRVICWAVVAVVAAFTFQASVGSNVVQLPQQTRVAAVLPSVLPQGWAFFTKAADSSALSVYRTEDGIENFTVAANADPSWVFGLNRSSRYQGLEITSLLQGIGEEAWTDCGAGGGVADCIRALPTAKSVENTMAMQTVCGRIAVVAEGVTEWAYRDLVDGALIPREAIELEVSCDN